MATQTKRKSTRATRRRSSASKEVSSAPTNEIVGLILLGLGFLHFLSLASFDLHDLPAWVKISTGTQTNVPVENFNGPVGAIVAGYSFFVFGVGSYLISVGLIWFGVSKLSAQLPLNLRTLSGFGLFVITGACLMQIQPFFFKHLRVEMFSLGAGGGLGFCLESGQLEGSWDVWEPSFSLVLLT